MNIKCLALAAAVGLAASAASAEDLVLSIGSRGYGPTVERDLKEFSKANPDINVEWNKVSDVPGETRKLYVTSLTARSPTPDVFALDVIWVGEFAQRGWLQPLNDLIPKKEIDEFNPALVSAATVNGKVDALPLYTDGIHLFYRKDLLEKYDLPVPKTWEQLVADSKKIMDGEGNPQFHGFVSMWAKIEGLFMNWLAFVNGNGGGFYDADGKLAINSPANIKATQFMVDLLKKERLAPDSILNSRPDDARTLFQQGRAAFLMVQGFVYEPLAAKDSPVAGKFDFTRVPYFEGHEDANTTTVGGWFLGINPNSKNKEAAAKLVSYFTGHDQQLSAAVKDNRAPTRPAVYKDPKIASAEVLSKFGKDYNFSVVRPSARTGKDYPRVSDVMQLEITRALHGEKSVEDALNDAQKEVEQILGQ
ncbi:ABC transporter substrate-binding protein [Pararhizobium mangrovi]|uniref:ABC transporter substrate-binding protein n=1 Tax=Pararhizobium mangrovi TaxID=2590452 RepID=A0A506TW96_9HYPH|nr:ABC transporter substrate-binding protein [Pararhizobium mangrovi]TPW25750.1 ABC transporter substrate-binding protein [Pararhizobium mangrovi]